jgi:hypothetical protein
MARKSFLYYLFSKNKAPLYVNDSGQVQEGDPGNYTKPDGQPARLSYSPDGWKDTLVKYARNIKYWGLFRDFSAPMRFVGDGAKILRNRFWSLGIEAICYIGIAKLDRTALPYNYRSWYMSEIDFTKYREVKTSVTVQAVEGGMTKYLKSNENTVYDISLSDDPEKFFVKMDGVPLTQKSNYQLVDDLEIDNSNYGGFHWLPFVFQNQESAVRGVSFQAQSLENINGLSYSQKLQSSNWFAQADIDNQATITMRVQGTIRIKCTDQDAANGLKIRFLRSNLPIGDQNAYEIISESPLVNNKEYTYNININLPLEPGERAYVEGFLGFTGVDTKYIFQTDSDISMDYESRYKTTYVECIYMSRLLELVLNRMTNNQYQFSSSFLTGKKDLAITTGNAIRGLPAVIRASLNDIFRSLGIFSVGLTVMNDKLIIERLDEFFKSDTVCELGVVDDIEITPAEDILFNTLRIGYEEQEYNDVNGSYEPNQGQQWSAPITKIVKEYDMTSVFRADPIGIELLRIDLAGLDTTDKKDDKEVFMLNIETQEQLLHQDVDFFSAGKYMTNPAGFPFSAGMEIRITGSVNNNNNYKIVAVSTNRVEFDPAGPPVVDETAAAVVIEYIIGGLYHLYRPAYTNIEGIPATMEPGIFNLEYSPKKNLLRNGRLIRSLIDYQDSESLKFASSDKNAELSTTLSGVTVTEREDIPIGSLGDRYFKPYYITLRTQAPVNVIELINANPFGRVKFTYEENDYYGYLMDGGIAPAKAGKDNDAQTWKLLSVPENDLSKLYN